MVSAGVTLSLVVISRVRKSIAVAVAILLTVVTLGRMRLNWTGGPGAAEGAEDPDRPSIARLH